MKPSLSTTARFVVSLALIGQLVAVLAAPIAAACTASNRELDTCGSVHRCACTPVVRALDQCCCGRVKVSRPSDLMPPCCVQTRKNLDKPAHAKPSSKTTHTESLTPDRCRCEKPLTLSTCEPAVPVSEWSHSWHLEQLDGGRPAFTLRDLLTRIDTPPAPPPKC